MSDPFTWAAIIAAASAAVGAGAAISSGIQQSKVAKFNAKVADQNAAAALQEGEVETERRRRLARIAQGQDRANIGASGILAEGSPLDLMEDNAAQLEIQAQQAKREAALRARGFNVQSSLDQFEGSTAKTRGYMGAASALLEGAGGVAGSYSKRRLVQSGSVTS